MQFKDRQRISAYTNDLKSTIDHDLEIVINTSHDGRQDGDREGPA